MRVQIHEPDVSPLQLQGPRSPEVARALFVEWAVGLGYYRLRETQLDGIPVVLARTGWSGEIGYELYLRDGRRGEELWERIMAAGRPYEIAPIAPSTIRSVEGGLLSYGSDIGRADDPFTLGFDRLVDLDQEAEFIGKAALRRIARQGAKRRLVGMEVEGEPLAVANAEFWRVSHAGSAVGHVTRCVYSPRLRRNIGFANVPVEASGLGTGLAVEVQGRRRGARVVATPFLESSRTIAR